jgi:hypothetical protein
VCSRFHDLLEAHQPPEFWVTRSRRFYAYFSKNLVYGHRWGARLQMHRDYGALKAEALGSWEGSTEQRVRMASELE